MDAAVTLVPIEHWSHRVEPGMKAYAVHLAGKRIGEVYQARETLERRSRGRVYVNRRWTAKRVTWLASVDGERTHFIYYPTRKQAVGEVVADWLRREIDQAAA